MQPNLEFGAQMLKSTSTIESSDGHVAGKWRLVLAHSHSQLRQNFLGMGLVCKAPLSPISRAPRPSSYIPNPIF
jgi:hypothetical protein